MFEIGGKIPVVLETPNDVVIHQVLVNVDGGGERTGDGKLEGYSHSVGRMTPTKRLNE